MSYLTKPQYLERYPWQSWIWDKANQVKNDKGQPGVYVRCRDCRAVIWVSMTNVTKDQWHDGLFHDNCVSSRQKIASRASITRDNNGTQLVGIKALTTEDHKFRLAKSHKTCKDMGVGIFSKETAEKRAKQFNDQNKPGQGFEKVCNETFGGHKERVAVFNPFSQQWTDIEFDSVINGYPIEWDDPHHLRYERENPGYHYFKDQVALEHYGHPCLHMISPCYWKGSKRRPRPGVADWKDCIQKYITDSLPPDFPLIDLANPIYGDIHYYQTW